MVDRLGTVWGEPPARQVQPGQLFVGDLGAAQLVGEARGRGKVEVVLVDHAQPVVRPLQEGRGTHQHGGATEEQLRQQLAAETRRLEEDRESKKEKLRVSFAGS